ncbi:Uncharacterised protein [Serratia liquefaciens]|uniref:hypothetical protein n=1 Tax=Serratia liquefaciens TaxID=614 RepID=UPI00217C8920|nr:hypothetical protein [Serratia liquefaciens]CAI0795454.1 Uncharacterised protein [Serratia liquefaciens]
MDNPISITPLLWRQQGYQSNPVEIRHGKGRQGIIIRPDGRRWSPPKGAFTHLLMRNKS